MNSEKVIRDFININPRITWERLEDKVKQEYGDDKKALSIALINFISIINNNQAYS